MPETKTKVVATLAEINLYLEGLGRRPLTSLREITEGTPAQYLANLKRQWKTKLGGVQGELFEQLGLFSPTRVAPWQPPSETTQPTGGITVTTPRAWIPGTPSAPGAWTPGTPSATGAPTGRAQFFSDPNYPGWQFDMLTGEGTYIGTQEQQQQSSLVAQQLGLTAFQQAQLEQQGQGLAWSKQQWQAEQDWREKQAAEEQRLLPERMALQWEIDRQRLLAGIASDDWVTQWVVQNQPNPYKQAAPSETSALEQKLDTETGRVQALEQTAMSRLLGGGSQSEAYQKSVEELEKAQTERDATYNLWKGAKTERRDWTPQPYPSAPEWLPKYAPGQVAGRMITAENVVTPSGQQLTQMPASTAGKLGYFADWTARVGGGRPWRDILAEAEISQPRTPSFGRSRWTPVGR